MTIAINHRTSGHSLAELAELRRKAEAERNAAIRYMFAAMRKWWSWRVREGVAFRPSYRI